MPDKTYVVDIDKTTEYTDTNGVTWWSNQYKGDCNVLDVYKNLVGKGVAGINGSFVSGVFEEDGKVCLKVITSEDVSGYFINPCLKVELSEDKHIEWIYSESTTLENSLLHKDYAVEGLLPFREVGGIDE